MKNTVSEILKKKPLCRIDSRLDAVDVVDQREHRTIQHET